ncbi:MAG TPA: hypothetical protein VN864_05360 [Thermoplasmata archaeon]|nr:hypothetical protein [Thermoplasmata archaeon]
MREPPTIRRRPPAAPSLSPARSAAEERAERIRFSLPLLVLAGASLLISFVLYSEAFAGHTSRVPLWVLALSVGVIASVGGSASLLVGDYSGDDWRAEAEASEQYVVVDRSRWMAIQALLNGAHATALGTDPTTWTTEPPPEWAEPVVPSGAFGRPTELPAGPEGPPAPMSITHGIESLATEVERMVADLEAVADAPAPPPPPVVPPTPVIPPVATPLPAAPRPEPPSPTLPRPTAAPPRSTDRPSPAPSAGRPPTRPEAPPGPARVRRSAPPAPRPVADPETEVAAEHRALLEELEQRAALALGTGALPSPARPPEKPGSARCVGCDARLSASERGNVCRSCRSPMCASCRDRSAKEGFSGLCALCSILEQSGNRDGADAS